jgi:hypothetical protein
MISRDHFVYYQPELFFDDGTNLEYIIPVELHSFEAFVSEEDCEQLLQVNGYDLEQCVIHEYKDDDIEEMTLLDADGNVIPNIDDLDDDELTDLLTDNVIWSAGSIDNLHTAKQDHETQQEYEDRIYTRTLDLVNNAIADIEQSGEYNFQTYGGTPYVEWYDEARDQAIKIVLGYMTENNQE